jgi:hypothetical protein
MTQTPTEPEIAENTSADANEKGPRLKRAFQWAAAIVAPFGIETPQRAFVQAGQAWDYTKTRIGAIVHRKPKI